MSPGIVIDNFAGGGGASTGIEQAIGRPIDYAINHDPQAIVMHRANHPRTYHYCEDVWEVDPREVAGGRPVSLAWFSPDCKHHSRAKGGKPVDKNIRGLAWVATRYAATVQPDLILLENVQEFAEWGPLKDGRPIPDLKGRTFQNWLNEFRKLGYTVDCEVLVACDFGSPTSRARLFVVARRDGRPIVWPKPTHGTEEIPYRTAAECIDWSIPCPSIFSRKKPLVENTLRRIARGLQRFVIDAPQPFIITYYGPKQLEVEFRGSSLEEPLRTQTTFNRFGLVVPSIIKHFGGATGSKITRPLPTITSRNIQNQLLMTYLTRPFGQGTGRPIDVPVPTITPGGMGKTGMVTSHLIKLRGTCRHGQDLREPMPTITAGGYHLGEVRAFLIQYNTNSTGQALTEPAHTLTTKDRLGLVTVAGEDYQIVDIGMRMLQPRELYRAQGFPEGYIIDPIYKGKPLTKTAQVRMVGNSVSPHPAEALVRANMAAA